MGNHSRLPSQNFSCIGIASFRRACKSIVSKRHSHRKISLNDRVEAEENDNSINEPYKGLKEENRCVHNNCNEKGIHNRDNCSPKGFFKHPNVDNFFRSSSQLSRSSSDMQSTSDTRSTSGSSPSPLLGSQTPTRAGSATARLKSVSQTSVDASSATGRGPIMYSNSNGLVKPPAMEKKLECTLEELCFGCIKKIKIRRDVVTDNGQIIQEEEVLTIKVKPGWTIGTKITFEGMGNETPGTHPADIIFVIEEKQHPLFRREGDDLELAIEIPLVKALTGFTLLIPLVGGESMSLTLDDIVYPGYEKIVEGQGMPVLKEQGKRGNLVLRFLVEFPKEMTEEQQFGAYRILKDCCDNGICSP